MILNNYSTAKSNVISNISIPNIEEPIKINILWLQIEDFNHKSKRLNQALHKHNFFEAHFVLDGKNIIVNKDNENTIISEGEGVLFNPNFLHRTQDSSNQLKRFSIAFQFLEENEIKKHLISNEIFASDRAEHRKKRTSRHRFIPMKKSSYQSTQLPYLYKTILTKRNKIHHLPFPAACARKNKMLGPASCAEKMCVEIVYFVF
jgi:hypothetical protein